MRKPKEARKNGGGKDKDGKGERKKSQLGRRERERERKGCHPKDSFFLFFFLFE